MHLSVKSKTMKLWEENIGKVLLNFGLGQNCLNVKFKTQATKAKINETTSNYKALQRKGKASVKLKGMGENICKPFMW